MMGECCKLFNQHMQLPSAILLYIMSLAIEIEFNLKFNLNEQILEATIIWKQSRDLPRHLSNEKATVLRGKLYIGNSRQSRP